MNTLKKGLALPAVVAVLKSTDRMTLDKHAWTVRVGFVVLQLKYHESAKPIQYIPRTLLDVIFLG